MLTTSAKVLPDITNFALSSDQVGDHKLIGKFGGAWCHHYEIMAIDRVKQLATLTPIYQVSVRNEDDDTYSSIWHRGTDPVHASK
jgi:hypothetical protein